MRFISGGPSIPDELLVARDAGDVIFFCGAGVSQAQAGLPNFGKLGDYVVEILGAAQDSRARLLLQKALSLDPMDGVGGLIATDRVFGLLEREFEISDVRAAVAEAIRPKLDAKLGAHRTIIDLATSRLGVTRLVTTNFDLLFEACDSSLASHGPPNLPDPKSDREFRGIVHLHGRVDADYRAAHDDEFVVSSADFGRAYLSEGWATKFIQSLLTRFQIVFVGYTADDPPVQYLLEALNLHAGGKNRLYAFQSGPESTASALWEHRGVHAIPFDSANKFAMLWDSLHAWAERAREPDVWSQRLFAGAVVGPEKLSPLARGQVAHLLSTTEGARQATRSSESLDAKWLLVLDPRFRYGAQEQINPYDKASGQIDPFDFLGLDSDTAPEPPDPSNSFSKRKAPADAIDVLEPNNFDRAGQVPIGVGQLKGQSASCAAPLSPRLRSLGLWLQQICHQPVALWWAAHQTGLYPEVQHRIEFSLVNEPQRFPEPIRQAWHLLFSTWGDRREDPDPAQFRIAARARVEGWTSALVRELAWIYRPKVTVEPSFGIPHPILWNAANVPERIVRASVNYPRPHANLSVPDDQLPYFIRLLCENFELAVKLGQEIDGDDRLHFETSRSDDNGAELPESSYGLTGPIIHFQNLVWHLAAIDREAARTEILRWPVADDYIFARLRIWAAGKQFLHPQECGEILKSLSDRVFWGHLHQRDLLYGLRDCWTWLSAEDRRDIESRLLVGSFPWSEKDDARRDELVAFDRLSRLHWLANNGVTFGFDLSATTSVLREVAPKWTNQAGDEAGKSHAPSVYSVVMDRDPNPLLGVPISEILSRSQEAGKLSFFHEVERDPFGGLVVEYPARALAALTHAARERQTPIGAWTTFLYSEARSQDSGRLVAVIIERLIRLPLEGLREIIFPVCDWMQRISDRLYSDVATKMPRLWNRVMESLSAMDDKRLHSLGRSWADDALNSPVGKLFDLLLKDPAVQGLRPKFGFPLEWIVRLDQLLALPSELRCHALVMCGFQLVWLYEIEPLWVDRALLSVKSNAGAEGDALWDGILWAGRPPKKSLFLKLKVVLTNQTYRPQAFTRHGGPLSGILLARWGGGEFCDPAEQLMDDRELREILIHCEDEFRRQILWHLRQFAAKWDAWQKRVIAFFQNVWPKQRALRTAKISGYLADFALESGEKMPAVVKALLPRLVPTGSGFMGTVVLDHSADNDPVRQHPLATLDLIWVCLGEDPAVWPYGIDRVIAFLSELPETKSDARLSELRRRIER